jgi:hypothetical protein
MPLEKARLLLGNDNELKVPFNPVSYIVKCPKKVEEAYINVAGKGFEIVNTVRDEPRSLSFELTFFSFTHEGSAGVNKTMTQTVNTVKNTLGAGSGTVQENLDKLFNMVSESQSSQYNGLTFAWKDLIFHGYVANIDVQHTMFAEDGSSIRASVSVMMIETPDPAESDFSGIDTPTTESDFENMANGTFTAAKSLNGFLPL